MKIGWNSKKKNNDAACVPSVDRGVEEKITAIETNFFFSSSRSVLQNCETIS